MRRDLSMRLVWLAGAGLLAGAAVAWMVGTAGPVSASVPRVPFALPVTLLIGWSLIGSGLLAWQSQSGSRLGTVLIFTGFAWFASALPDAHNPVLFTVGEAVYAFYYAGFLYLILSFPAGRLQGTVDRALMVVTIGLVTIGQWAWLLFADSRTLICRTCPANLLEVAREDTVARLLYSMRGICVLATALTGIVLLAGRWHRASRPQRQAVMPVAVAGVVAIAAITASYVASVLGARAVFFAAAGYYAAAAVSVAVLVVFIQRRLAQTAVAGLVVELGARSAAADLREALSRALGDPSLMLAYWYPAESRYVDSDGGPV